MHTIAEHWRHRKEPYFKYPEVGEIRPFDQVLEHVYSLEPVEGEGSCSYTVGIEHAGRTRNLSARVRTLSAGKEGEPTIVHLPWYGGVSFQTRHLVLGRSHPHWTHVGVDLFHGRDDNFNTPYLSAEGAQYAYALGMRAMDDQVRLAHEHNIPVGVVGVSYGANVISAYAASAEHQPDALVVVEGGSMPQLAPRYADNCDPRTLEIIDDPSILPSQHVPQHVLDRTYAVLNPNDDTVLGQYDIWGTAAHVLKIEGTHMRAPFNARKTIRHEAVNHLQTLLG